MDMAHPTAKEWEVKRMGTKQLTCGQAANLSNGTNRIQKCSELT